MQVWWDVSCARTEITVFVHEMVKVGVCLCGKKKFEYLSFSKEPNYPTT